MPLPVFVSPPVLLAAKPVANVTLWRFVSIEIALLKAFRIFAE